MSSNGVSSRVSSSTTDLDVLYERITISTSQKRISPCKQTGTEYPEYAVEELALFQKLQSRSTQTPAKMNKVPIPIGKTINLGIEILPDDIPKNVSVPDQDSDSTDCEVLWVGPTKSPDPVEKFDVNKNLVADNKNVKLRDCDSSGTSIEESRPDQVRLSADNNLPSNSSKSLEEKLKKLIKNKPEKPSPYQCKICSLSLASVDDLKIHLMYHIKTSQGQADIYRQSHMLLEHLQAYKATTGKQRKQRCKFCNETFVTRTALLEHTTTVHASSRPYKCLLCPKNYTCLSHLRRHESLSHKSEKKNIESLDSRAQLQILGTPMRQSNRKRRR